MYCALHKIGARKRICNSDRGNRLSQLPNLSHPRKLCL